jgi:hypothetical protein
MKSFHHLSTTTTLFLFLSLFCSGGALAGTTKTKRTTTPTPPGLSYLGTVNIDLAPPIEVGVGPLGDRNIFAIEGGTFAGPIFNGGSILFAKQRTKFFLSRMCCTIPHIQNSP